MIDPDQMSDPASFNVIDLFSGIGGFTLGFRAATGSPGFCFRPRLMVDNDREAREVATRNLPDIPFLAQDISRLSAAAIRAAAKLGEKETIHVLVGGPPCQGFSRLGGGALHDPRNVLMLEFLRVVKELRPLVVLMENVPAVITSHGGVVIHEVVESLSAMGYSSVYGNQLASDYGVPQARRRAILLGYRADLGMLPRIPQRSHERVGKAVYMLDAGKRIVFEETKLPYISVEEAIGDLPALDAGRGDEVMFYDKPPQNSFQRWAREGAFALFNHRSRVHSAEYLKKVSIISEGGGNKKLPKDQQFSDNYFSQAYARLHREAIGQTITTYFANPGSGRFLHYRDLRSITVREAARFQSFQDTFVFDGPLSAQMRHVGNAVPPLMARAFALVIGEDLLAAGVHRDSKSVVTVKQPRPPEPREIRSRTMRAVPSKNSKPELALRKALAAAGIRGYRLHDKRLAGSPDIVFPRFKVALFVDGCFWHGCPACHRAPKVRAEYWTLKVKRNQERDAKVVAELEGSGWMPVRIWEHEIRDDEHGVIKRVKAALRSMKPRARAG